MFVLGRPIPNGPLAQGEILRNLVQYRVDTPAVADQPAVTVAIEHPLVVVVTQICDLQHDFKARFHTRTDLSIPQDYKDKPQKHLLEGVLLCKAQMEAAFRDGERGINSGTFTSAQKNQHERYHCIGPLRSHNEPEGAEYRLFLDFKRLWLCPPEALYPPIHAAPDTHRLGIIPDMDLARLMQRFHAFHGRIGLPDLQNDIPYKMLPQSAPPAAHGASGPKKILS